MQALEQILNKTFNKWFTTFNYRKHQVTERQNCKAAQEMTYLADSYATYLQSQRKWKEIHEEYHKQELSVQQTADKVGFKLPHDPK